MAKQTEREKAMLRIKIRRAAFSTTYNYSNRASSMCPPEVRRVRNLYMKAGMKMPPGRLKDASLEFSRIILSYRELDQEDLDVVGWVWYAFNEEWKAWRERVKKEPPPF